MAENEITIVNLKNKFILTNYKINKGASLLGWVGLFLRVGYPCTHYPLYNIYMLILLKKFYFWCVKFVFEYKQIHINFS